PRTGRAQRTRPAGKDVSRRAPYPKEADGARKRQAGGRARSAGKKRGLGRRPPPGGTRGVGGGGGRANPAWGRGAGRVERGDHPVGYHSPLPECSAIAKSLRVVVLWSRIVAPRRLAFAQHPTR